MSGSQLSGWQTPTLHMDESTLHKALVRAQAAGILSGSLQGLEPPTPPRGCTYASREDAIIQVHPAPEHV